MLSLPFAHLCQFGGGGLDKGVSNLLLTCLAHAVLRRVEAAASVAEDVSTPTAGPPTCECFVRVEMHACMQTIPVVTAPEERERLVAVCAAVALSVWHLSGSHQENEDIKNEEWRV